MLRSGWMAALAALALVACAAPEGENIATQSRVCDQEVTGSHFKRCTRDGSVQSVSREEMEMTGMRPAPMTRDPAASRGR